EKARRPARRRTPRERARRPWTPGRASAPVPDDPDHNAAGLPTSTPPGPALASGGHPVRGAARVLAVDRGRALGGGAEPVRPGHPVPDRYRGRRIEPAG